MSLHQCAALLAFLLRVFGFTSPYVLAAAGPITDIAKRNFDVSAGGGINLGARMGVVRKAREQSSTKPAAEQIATRVVRRTGEQLSTKTTKVVREPATGTLQFASTTCPSDFNFELVGPYHMGPHPSWDADVWGPCVPNDLPTTMHAKSMLLEEHREDVPARRRLAGKLADRECLRLVALGGSGTAGNFQPSTEFVCGPDKHKCARPLEASNGIKIAWPNKLSHWLNSKFPCRGEHEVKNLGSPGKGASFWPDQIMEWKSQPDHPINLADIVVIETACNDELFAENSIRQGVVTQNDQLRSYVELIARQLLTLPLAPSVLWADLYWKGEHVVDVIDQHEDVLRHYGIALASAFHALGDGTPGHNPWLKTYYFWDGWHPSVLGHKLAAQIVGHALLELPYGNRKSLPPPRWSILDQFYTTGKQTSWKLDDGSVEASIVENTQPGFAVRSDGAHRPPALLATTAGARLLLGLKTPLMKPGRHLVNLGLMKSYALMGSAEVSFRTSPSIDGHCNQQFLYQRQTVTHVHPGPREVDCLWQAKASVYDAERFFVDVPADGQTHECLWMSLRVLDKQRESNHMKLFRVALISP